MKNFIPLVLAVVLGLAAVLTVARYLNGQQAQKDTMVEVVVAATDIAENEELAGGGVMRKLIPSYAKPAMAIDWSKRDDVVGQKALRMIPRGDYVLSSDIGLSRSSGNIVPVGEWAVSIPQADSGISKILKPGDEVAILGTFKIDTKVKTADESQPEKIEKREGTLVLLPKVRVVDVVRNRNEESGASEIIVALPPKYVGILVAAQRVGELSFALRKANDMTQTDRRDVGIIDSDSFSELLDGLEVVKLPKDPSKPENRDIPKAK
jgi:Flp pilus assembly protein CpaB